jgi:type II secretory pathway pseudopilin PulG
VAERSDRWRESAQIIEVTILALVALATAWTGYQSSKWDARQTLLYGQANTLRFAADAASTKGGQQLVADSSMFNGWLTARAAHQSDVEDLYVRRFSPEYRTAFDAWLKTDPFTNSSAPAGPGYMPQYKNPLLTQADEQNAQAAKLFEEGTSARETSDKYVRDTVLFASVLFMVAIAGRFDKRAPRIAALAVSVGLLAFVTVSLVSLPRL